MAFPVINVVQRASKIESITTVSSCGKEQVYTGDSIHVALINTAFLPKSTSVSFQFKDGSTYSKAPRTTRYSKDISRGLMSDIESIMSGFYTNSGLLYNANR